MAEFPERRDDDGSEHRDRFRSLRVATAPLRFGRLRAAWLWALAGLALGIAAPAGSLLIRLAASGEPLPIELGRNAFFYLYELVGTSLVFGIAGWFAGRRADLLRRNLATYRDLSEIDDLTGMPNTRAFERHYLRAIEHAQRYREPFSLLFIDLDELKSINDTWGHHHGSEAIAHVASAIRAVKRQTDFAARWGGDEFVVAMHGADRGAAERLANAVVERLRRRPLPIGEHRVPVTVTIGVATTEPDAPSRSLFEDADKALYEGKRRGRNRVQSAMDDAWRHSAH